MEKLVDLLAGNPARRFGLEDPVIEEGARADLTVFDLDASYRVDPSRFLSMGRSTPFAGRTVFGRCLLTVAGGTIAWREKGGADA